MKVLAIVFIACALLSQVSCNSRQWRGNGQSSEDYRNDSVDQQVTRMLSATAQGLRTSSSTHPAITSPDAVPFKNKVNERLEKSEPLSAKSEIKEKIRNIAEQKLSACRSAQGEADALDMHCVGRLTGQMMQLIAAIENVNRNLPNHRI